MNGLVNATAGHLITLSRLATIEVPAGLARRKQEASISDNHFRDSLNAFLRAAYLRYQLVEADAAVCDLARDLVIRHPLRAYDAVQLASALKANQVLSAANLSALSFISADTRLTTVAQLEGLPVDNPNLHP